MKDKEEKLQKEEGKVQVLKYAIDIMEKEESELLSNLTKTPLTSGKYSSSHMTLRLAIFDKSQKSTHRKYKTPKKSTLNADLKLPELSHNASKERINVYQEPFSNADQFSTVVVERSERYTTDRSMSSRFNAHSSQ